MSKSLFSQPSDKTQKGFQILVVNSGSSSLKISWFSKEDVSYVRLIDAHLKGMNVDEGRLIITSVSGVEDIPVHKKMSIDEGLKLIIETLQNKYAFVPTALEAVGHRFVHGGSQYLSSVGVNRKVISELEKLVPLAPLHNESCVLGIKKCADYFGKSILQVAVFDTAFHRFQPPVAANYAIESNVTSKYAIKRYGFHGISNAFVCEVYKKHFASHFKKSKIILLHLGNGCSITAVREGTSIENSMGFTPEEGLIMGTRAGDIDASIVEFLCREAKQSPSEVMQLLNFHSGLLGISGLSSDVKTLLDQSKTNAQAQLAIDMFCYRILKYVGAYIAILGGVDALIFSGGIGENAPEIRQQIVNKLSWYGIKMDAKKNTAAVGLLPGTLKNISLNSSAELYVVATDENQFIAKEAYAVATHEA